MLLTRFIPVLGLLDGALVKTVRFKTPRYIGDPVNTVRIFNELEADELCLLDIRATATNSGPDFALLQALSSESFCPVSYGGGIHTEDDAARIFSLGFEKIILGSVLAGGTALLSRLAARYGSQAVVASVDVQRDLLGRYGVYVASGTARVHRDPAAWAATLEESGAGEILLTAVQREGTWTGYDTGLISAVSSRVGIPVVAHGGAGNLAHLSEAVRSGASAVAAGSLVAYQRKGLGVLINLPDRAALRAAVQSAAGGA